MDYSVVCFLQAVQKDTVLERRLQSALFLSQYYASYYEKDFVDRSFVVYRAEQCMALVICYQIHDSLQYHDGGVRIFIQDPSTDRAKLFLFILSYLEELADKFKARAIQIKQPVFFREPDGALRQEIQEIFLNRQYQADLYFDMTVSYAGFEPSVYKKNIRKSYKSLIHWGQKNMRFSFVHQGAPNRALFEDFRAFHALVSGSHTRSEKSWDSQYQMLCAGYGELVVGYYQEKLASASLFLDDLGRTLYAVGVYDRSLFEFGVSHALLYEGICRSAQKAHAEQMFLGVFDPNLSDPKKYNIQFFKKGFCQELLPYILWKK